MHSQETSSATNVTDSDINLYLNAATSIEEALLSRAIALRKVGSLILVIIMCLIGFGGYVFFAAASITKSDKLMAALVESDDALKRSMAIIKSLEETVKKQNDIIYKKSSDSAPLTERK